MSVFSRLSDIINSNINAMLEKAENPEKISRLIIQEMEDTLVEVRSTTAKSIADKKERQRHLKQAQLNHADWTAKAELALSRGREDLARAALFEKKKSEHRCDLLETELSALEEQLQKFNVDIGKLEAKIIDAKKRQHELTIRHKTAETQLKTKSQINNHKIDDVLMRFDLAEQKIEEVESRVEAMDFGNNKNLNEQIDDLQNDDEISQELEAMKSRVKRAAGGE